MLYPIANPVANSVDKYFILVTRQVNSRFILWLIQLPLTWTVEKKQRNCYLVDRTIVSFQDPILKTTTLMITKIAILQQSCIVALHLWNSLKQQEQKICKSLKIRIPESNLNLFIDKGGNILSIKGSETMFPCISLLLQLYLSIF